MPQKSQSHTVEFRPALPFEPPKGFRAIPTPLKPRSDAGTVFENLEGKQIWHITAPAGLSLSELKKITMDKALAGAPILSDNGIDYGFVAGQSDELGEREVLIPRQNGYKAGRLSVPFIRYLLTCSSFIPYIQNTPHTTSHQATQTRSPAGTKQHRLRSSGIDYKKHDTRPAAPIEGSPNAVLPFWIRRS